MLNRIKRSKHHKTINEGMLVLFDQGLLSIATFVTGILIAKGTSKEEFGVYILCWSLLNISISFSDAAINRPFALLSPKLSSDDINIYQGSALIHTLLFCTIWAIALFVILPLTNNQLSNLFSPELILVLIIALFPFLLRRFMRASALARLHVSAGVSANAIASSLQIITLFSFFRLDLISTVLAYYVIAACSSIAALLIYIREKEYFTINLGRIYYDFLSSCHPGKWLVLNASAYTVISQAYLWLLAVMLDIEDIAIYGACMSISAVVAPLLRGLDSYILPRMTHGLHKNGQKALLKILWVSTVIISIPYTIWFFAGTLLADTLLINLYSSEYSGHAILVGLLILRYLIDSSATPVTNALQVLGETKQTSIALLYGTISTGILGPLLIHNMGLEGAGLAGLISALVIAGYKWHMVFKLSKNTTVQYEED